MSSEDSIVPAGQDAVREHIYYRRLRHYKYELAQDYRLAIPIRPTQEIVTSFIELSPGGALLVRRGYAWDGPSGPTLDTPSFMRGSLVHDALYQLMRMSKIDHKTCRKQADDLLRDLCLEDGMDSRRAWYVRYGVRLFAEANARPETNATDPQATIVVAP